MKIFFLFITYIKNNNFMLLYLFFAKNLNPFHQNTNLNLRLKMCKKGQGWFKLNLFIII